MTTVHVQWNSWHNLGWIWYLEGQAPYSYQVPQPTRKRRNASLAELAQAIKQDSRCPKDAVVCYVYAKGRKEAK